MGKTSQPNGEIANCGLAFLRHALDHRRGRAFFGLTLMLALFAQVPTPSLAAEFRVNTTTASSQQSPSVAGLNGGGFVVVWQSNHQKRFGFGIYGQQYTAAGEAEGTEFRVNTFMAGDQTLPSVAGLSDGGFVVIWQSDAQDGSGLGIYGQRYAAVGTPVGSEFRVNTTTVNDQSRPVVAGLRDGGFIVAWEPHDSPPTFKNIYAQRYASTGAPSGAEFRATAAAFDHTSSLPAVTALADGGFQINWKSNLGILGKRYTAAGLPKGRRARFNFYRQYEQTQPCVAGLDDGGFAVAWQTTGENRSATDSGVHAVRYDKFSKHVGPEFRINTATAGNQYDCSVAAFTDGGFVVAWTSDGQDGSGKGVYAKAYDAAATPVTLEFRVNTTAAMDQSQPSVAAFSAGRFVVVWTSRGQDGSEKSDGIYAQQFEIGSVAPTAGR